MYIDIGPQRDGGVQMLLMKPELVARLDTPDGLQHALEQAIKLEHATLPPYLYAMFSLMPGSNREIASLLHGIVMEEMGHMALACNLLDAVGGSPQISTPEAIPTYPGPLPGTVENQLTVNLAAFSIERVRDTFMVIEAPEEPIVFEDAISEKPLTIGELWAPEEVVQVAFGGEAVGVTAVTPPLHGT